jgi:hypothetical protein
METVFVYTIKEKNGVKSVEAPQYVHTGEISLFAKNVKVDLYVNTENIEDIVLTAMERGCVYIKNTKNTARSVTVVLFVNTEKERHDVRIAMVLKYVNII